MTLKESIIQYIHEFPGATDAEISKHLNKRHQAINQTCNRLKKQGILIRIRQINPDKNHCLGNYLKSADIAISLEQPSYLPNHPLQEEAIKHILTVYLKNDGWDVKTAWGHTHGVDIEAIKGTECWKIEIKGPGSRSAMRTNYFLSILGETLRRMDDPCARYSIAFPDMKKYRTLWASLPQLAKDRTTIDLLLIDANGNINILK